MAIGFCTDQQDFQPVIGVPAIVAQKLRIIAAIIDGDVDVAVIVLVPDGNALTVVSFPAHAGFLGDVGKCSVTIIVVKRRAQGLRWFVNASAGRLDTVEIHQAALVIIDPTDAAAHGFEAILFFRLRGILTKSDSGRLSNVGVTDGYSGILRFRSLSSGSSYEGLQQSDCLTSGLRCTRLPDGVLYPVSIFFIPRLPMCDCR